MPVRCVICDFGNVIGFFDHWSTCRALVRLSRIGVDEHAVYDLIFGGELEADYDCGRISTPEFLRRLRQDLSLEASDAEITRAWCDIFTPNAQVARIISDLRTEGIRLVLASNTNELHHDWFSRQFSDTLAHFDAQVLSFKVGQRKPDGRFFEACLAAAVAVAPSECVYIDDRADFVARARSFGLSGIAYTPGLPLDARRISGARRRTSDLNSRKRPGSEDHEAGRDENEHR